MLCGGGGGGGGGEGGGGGGRLGGGGGERKVRCNYEVITIYNYVCLHLFNHNNGIAFHPAMAYAYVDLDV